MPHTPQHTAKAAVAQDLAQLEVEAKATARKHVANQLQRPEQLDKVEQIRKRVSRKKSSVEAMLKTAVQSQLDGVRTGLNQLQNAHRDIKDIKEGLAEVDVTYTSIADLGEKLKKVRAENTRHSQLAAAVENMKHIFNVPETVKKCQDLINESKLLHAHKCLTDLEVSRDDLLFELHKQTIPSPTDKNTVNHYFADVEKLSDSLGKQLFLILQRTVMTVRREPTIIVTVVRIIEREERTDTMMLRRYEQTGFIPPARPKRWKIKAFKVLEEAVLSRIEGSQMDDRSTDKMWLVRHLEVIRQLTVEDLRVIKTLCEPCFPPLYHITDKYVEMYHNSISQHFQNLVEQGLEGNEIVCLLTWIGDYGSVEMMGHPELKVDMTDMKPLLDTSKISELQNQYLQTMRANFKEWMGNSLKTDVQDWYLDSKPEADTKGFYNTSLPVLLFQILEQNLIVASTINDNLVLNVINLCTDELAFFARTYEGEVRNYKEKHFLDRNELQYFLLYMMACINNCQTIAEFTGHIKNNFLKESSLEIDAGRLKVVADAFHKLAFQLCDSLVEEVFMDLDTHIQELFTRKWTQTSNAVDTICITVEDYCQDFVHLKDKFYEFLLYKAQEKVAMEYLKAMFSRKITFKNYDERLPCAEKIVTEGEQLSILFKKLETKSQGKSPFDALPGLAEVIKLKDTSMMSLELSGFITDFPDIRTEQLINLLMMRGDMGRNEARQLVLDCLGDDHDTKPKNKRTVFSHPEL